MRTTFYAQLLSSVLVLGLTGLAACGGDKDDEDTADTDTDTDTDPGDTDTDTDTDVQPTTGFARVVNLIPDGLPDNPTLIDISLDGAATPLVPDVPFGNTDAEGSYAPFPPNEYTVSASIDGEVVAEIADAPVVAGEYYTVVFYGSPAAGALDPALGPMATYVTDDMAMMEGMHHLRIFHAAVGGGPLDVTYGDGTAPQIDDLGYGEWSSVQMTDTGEVTFSVDVDGDGNGDGSFTATLADADWSYIYLIPDGAGGVLAFHHVALAPIVPLPVSAQ